ncbi:hypothetical protein D5086_011659 [Populus alba]|uniref:Thioredoxin-like fold domain-containing protein n=3 Tax=Populus TaxID=3689 RepID=A0A4U5Q008_POPAL|nr:uncharacterized protein LOC118061992 [Populus alba]KAG6776615.1 hypothetical protein POTOM_020136 [Populus tomentosa]TKS03223.1 hypothetical protein D5086_0000152200 [Populus alba]
MQRQHRCTLTQLLSFMLLPVVNLSILTVQSQNLPPARYDGFVYENRQGDLDSILVEAFFDPVCPDSRDSWPPLKEALKHYGSRVWLVVHLLPLPYHDNAFVSSRALHIANTLNSSFTFPLLEEFFKHQEKFYNAKTSNLSKTSIVEEIVKFATVAVGNSYSSAFESGFNDRQTDLKTRVSFKYSTSRGVFGTPFFFVNGFVLPDAGSPLDYNGWRSIIDPLAGAKSSQSINVPHFI